MKIERSVKQMTTEEVNIVGNAPFTINSHAYVSLA